MTGSSLSSFLLPPRHGGLSHVLARVLGLLLVAWQPFISGPRLPSLALLLLGAWMLLKRKIDLMAQSARRLGLIFMLLLIPVLLSLPASLHVPSSLNVALALVSFGIVGLALLQGLTMEAAHAWLQRWLLITVCAWMFDGVLQLAIGRDLLGVALGEAGQVYGPFSGNLRFGLLVTVLMPVVFWRLVRRRPWLSLILIVLLGFLAGMSGARSNLVFFLLSCAVLLPRFGRWQRMALLAAGCSVVLAVASLSPAMGQRWSTLVRQWELREANPMQAVDTALSGRLTIWQTAWHMVEDRPLTGVGAGAFARAYDHYSSSENDPFRSSGSYGSPSHAHQMYVSMAAETGWVGLVSLIIVIGLCIRWYKTAPPPQRALAAPYAAALAVIAFPLQSQPVLYIIWWFPVVLLLLCGLLAALHPGENEPPGGR